MVQMYNKKADKKTVKHAHPKKFLLSLPLSTFKIIIAPMA